MYLNYLGNYVPNAWNYEHGCGHCHDDVLDSSQFKVSAAVSSPRDRFPWVSSRRLHVCFTCMRNGGGGGRRVLRDCGAGFGFRGFHKVVLRGLSTGSPSASFFLFFLSSSPQRKLWYTCRNLSFLPVQPRLGMLRVAAKGKAPGLIGDENCSELRAAA